MLTIRENIMARPSKFNDETIQKAEEYIVNYADHGDIVPSVAGLSRVLEVSRSTINAWRHEKEGFSDILESVLTHQERILLNKGLTGEFNSNIVKLMLGKHGYSDKQKTEVSGVKDADNVWTIEVVHPARERINDVNERDRKD